MLSHLEISKIDLASIHPPHKHISRPPHSFLSCSFTILTNSALPIVSFLTIAQNSYKKSLSALLHADTDRLMTLHP